MAAVKKENIFTLKTENKNRNTATAVVVLAVAAVLLAIDQMLKYFVLRDLRPVGTVTVIPGLLELTYVENTGAAFGLFKQVMWLVVAVTVVATVAIIVLLFRYKRHSFFSYTTAALLMAGGIGNLIDRIAHGFVVDYIHVLFFDYVFNFADCCITVGAGACLSSTCCFSPARGKRHFPGSREANEPPASHPRGGGGPAGG